MFKKVYIEITNNCNLNCEFCVKNKRIKKFMTEDEFKDILNKLNGYTKYLYFHLMGEPLLHPLISEFIDIASKNYFVNITTNGYLIKNILNKKNIRQLNISLHSFDEKNGKSLDDYINDIFTVTDNLSNNTYIQYRLWVKSKYYNNIIAKLSQKYNLLIESGVNIKLSNNIYLNFDDEFRWPSLNDSMFSETGTCLGTRTHIGILSDGTVVPCCLDSEGTINLGNIFNSSLSDIINSKDFLAIKNGFLCNKRVHPLCCKCRFNQRDN